jgi:hypothetical protein
LGDVGDAVAMVMFHGLGVGAHRSTAFGKAAIGHGKSRADQGVDLPINERRSTWRAANPRKWGRIVVRKRGKTQINHPPMTGKVFFQILQMN